MNIIAWTIINIIVPIAVSLITVFLTMYFKRTEKGPKLLLTYSKLNGNNFQLDNNLIMNYWKMEKKLDNEFKSFLKDEKYYDTYHMDKLLEDTVKIYKNREHLKNGYHLDDRNVQICKMINSFKNNIIFMSHIKKYEVYFDNSNWNIKILNIGNATSYDFCITSSNKEYENGVVSSKNLDVKEYVLLNLKYFDQSIRINTFDFGGYSKFEFGFSRHKSTSFYIVKKESITKKMKLYLKYHIKIIILNLENFIVVQK